MESKRTLEVINLKTHFFTRMGIARAVDGVSFSINQGEIMGLVGESGSGKSVTGFSLINLVDPPGKIVSGEILFKGEQLLGRSEQYMSKLRGNRISMIFQDPMMTLNPVLRIDTQMIEAVLAHQNIGKESARKIARDALGKVGISSPDERLKAYPHQFSGGMRQRVSIAIALINKPDLIIADEPTTALDVTIQGQILHEVQKLCREMGTALIWITHDLAVVAGLVDKISVMYAGKIVEEGAVDDILDKPVHPYTIGLIRSIPSRNERGKRLQQIPGMAPSLLNLPSGCSFSDRCSVISDACSLPPEVSQPIPGRTVRCFNPQKENG